MQLAFSVKNGQSLVVMPYLPPEFELPIRVRGTETFESLQGPLILMGNFTLRQLSWSASFPKGKKTYTHSHYSGDPMAYVAWFNKYIAEKIPFRVAITDNGKSLLNMACHIDSFSYNIDVNGDVNYSISVTEFPIPPKRKG